MPLPADFNEFKLRLEEEEPPVLWPEALRSLWWDARGDWENSHLIAQEIQSPIGFWIHGYLHRKEGDRWNATYWYERAGRSYPANSLDEELEELVVAALGTG